MQIAPTSPTVAAIVGAAANPSFARIDFGSVQRGGPNFTLRTGTSGGIGERTGYTSLKDAIGAARLLTAATKPAAAVFEVADRYYLNRVNVYNGWTLERQYDNIGGFRETSFTFGRSDVRALIDGEIVIRAGKVGEPVAFPS